MMKLITSLKNLAILGTKYTLRNRARSLLTIMGVAIGMFLFTAIETIQGSLNEATFTTAKDTTLVVYRENRFCPSTSRLPEHYKDEITRIKGVQSVTPIQIVVNNCGTSLDVVVFRGVPSNLFGENSENFKLIRGSFENCLKKEDGALIGKNLANRRNLNVGDKFDAAGITVQVCGIINAKENTQNDNVAFVHLSFLQQASRVGLGIVTQFNVKVEDPSLLESVATSIDKRFSTDTEPTTTQPEKAFFANTAMDLIELIRFSRWIGLACVFAVIALVGNTILLTVRGKISEHALLKTLGYSKLYLGWVILSESIFLSLIGGLIGILSAYCFLQIQSLSIGNEGLVLAFIPTFQVVQIALLAAISLGLLAGIYPAWQAGRKPICESLKPS